MKFPLHTRILIGMLAGILAGVIIHIANPGTETVDTLVQWIKPIGDIFLRLIFMMVIPLIVCALTLGVAGFGNLKKVGRAGIAMLKFTLVATSIAVLLGVGLANIFQPGKGLSVEQRTELISKFSENTREIKKTIESNKERNAGQIITQMIPKNPLEDMSRAFDPTYTGGGLIAVIIFSLILGLALLKSNPQKTAVFKSFLEGMYEVVMKVIHFGMLLAPFGVASLLFVLTLTLGLSLLGILLKYLLVVVLALLIHQFVIYPIILKFFSKTSPLWFFKNIREVMITAFSTSSSSASLPIAIEATTENLKMPKDISNFILTLGSTTNQNGTALFQGITILFLAQCFGVELNFWQQLVVISTSILAGIGTVGVPGGSLPILMLILIYLGVPGESIAIIYGLDRILDMCRTVINVTGDVVAVAYISNKENIMIEA